MHRWAARLLPRLRRGHHGHVLEADGRSGRDGRALKGTGKEEGLAAAPGLTGGPPQDQGGESVLRERDPGVKKGSVPLSGPGLYESHGPGCPSEFKTGSGLQSTEARSGTRAQRAQVSPGAKRCWRSVRAMPGMRARGFGLEATKSKELAGGQGTRARGRGVLWASRNARGLGLEAAESGDCLLRRKSALLGE